jgi:hypothetical protein
MIIYSFFEKMKKGKKTKVAHGSLVPLGRGETTMLAGPYPHALVAPTYAGTRGMAKIPFTGWRTSCIL